jgi:hypothetical protein
MYLFIFHLYINIISKFVKKSHQLRLNLKLLLPLYIQRFIFNQKDFQSIKNIKKEKLRKINIMWIYLINALYKKKIFIEEYREKNLQKKNIINYKSYVKKKFLILKKYKKFYRQYLRTSLIITNNLFVCKFLETQKGAIPGIFNIILLKNIYYYLFEIRFLKNKKIVYFKRKIVNRKYSVSRAFLLSKKSFNF